MAMIEAVEDVFALPDASWISEVQSAFARPDKDAKPVSCGRRFFCRTGPASPGTAFARAAEVAARRTIAVRSTAAFVALAATSPSGLSMGFYTVVDVGNGYSTGSDQFELGTFSPTFALLEDVAPGAATLRVPRSPDDWFGREVPPELLTGSAARIGDEILRIDRVEPGMTSDLNENGSLILQPFWAVTVGRGCCDTVPAAHAAGSLLWCADVHQDYGFDEREFAAGMTARVKALVRTGAGTLPKSRAPASVLPLTGRAARPYPPATVKLNGQLFPATIQRNVPLAISWAHRDRIAQADLLVDWLAPSTGPEEGVTCDLQIYGGDAPETLAPRKTVTGLTGTSYAWMDEDAPGRLAVPAAALLQKPPAQRRLPSAGSAQRSLQLPEIRLDLPTRTVFGIAFKTDVFL
ncbi:MAG: hypothetical protein LBS30_02885 [Planctomycetota bacterium]|jgi:hypothetical protein|nr:hypothetical protein [Planctomycetota bacterium]